MQVILTKRVRNLGNIGDVVSVKPGYSRNFLIPYNLAISATKANVAEFEHKREALEQAATDALSAAQARAEKVAALTVSIAAQAADEGKLYGSISIRDVALALTKAGVAIEKSEVVLPEGPIRMVGDHAVNLFLHPEVEVQIQINVTEEK